jgi:hypothetical protein
MTTKPKSKKLSSANTATPTNITVSTIPTWSLGTSMTAPITVGAVGAGPYTFNTYKPTSTIKVGKINITESDIEIDALSLRDTLAKVNERLAIFRPNPELEKDFDQLKALRDQYIELEKDLMEKAQAWNTLKNTDTK